MRNTTVVSRQHLGRRLRHAAAATLVAIVAASPVLGQEEAKVVEYVGSVELTPWRGVAGTEVSIAGSDFEPGTDVEIVWNSVEGAWLLEGTANEEFVGREFLPTRTPMTTTSVDADGSFEAAFEAPVDYGFSHDVTVESDGRLLNKAGFRLEPTLTVTPTSGPVGTPITVRMEGVGWGYLENSWQLTYDNQYTGVMTSVTSDGVAEATIPATGGVGPHRIRIVHGAFTVPYLNGQQSPRPDRVDYEFDFEITPGEAVMPLPAVSQALPVEAAEAPTNGDGPEVWSDVASGPVGTPMTIFGRGFEPGQDLSLAWTSVVGNRISGSGWDEVSSDLDTVSVAEDGTFQLEWAIPDDLGGPHRLVAMSGELPLAETSVTITPSLVSSEVVRGPFGEMVEINLKGVGWTETANIYNLVYDNAFLGYSCGFNSQGDVTINMPLTGAEGWHYVDLYPGIYKGEDMGGVQNFRTPQLTFEADHPGERLPAFRLAFEIMPGDLAAIEEGQAVLAVE